jgi:hypothetical protein
MASRGARRGARGFFYLQAVGSVCRGLDHHGLGGGAVRSERRSELSARVWSNWSGVKRCRQGWVTFRVRARLVELTPIASVDFG